jgi:hypothetical protein
MDWTTGGMLIPWRAAALNERWMRRRVMNTLIVVIVLEALHI